MTPIIPQDAPRSPEVLAQDVRAGAACRYCGAAPGRPCKGLDLAALHLARYVRALRDRQITVKEIAVVLGDLDKFTEATVIYAAGGAR